MKTQSSKIGIAILIIAGFAWGVGSAQAQALPLAAAAGPMNIMVPFVVVKTKAKPNSAYRELLVSPAALERVSPAPAALTTKLHPAACIGPVCN